MTIKYIAEAKKWFDRINGNTYFSLIITDTQGKQILNSPFNYGYGEQYRHEAINFLIKNGFLTEKDRFNHELIRNLIYFSVSEVSRKKDL